MWGRSSSKQKAAEQQKAQAEEAFMLEEEERKNRERAMKPSKQVRRYMVLSVVIYFIYVAGMPFWSMFFNDVLGFWRWTCHTSSERMDCFHGIVRALNDDFESFTEVAKRSPKWADRSWGNRYLGCGVGEGVFPEWQCPVYIREWAGIPSGGTGFTLSYFLGTAPSTGGMVTVSIFPIGFMWWFGLGSPQVMEYRLHLEENSVVAKTLYRSLFCYTVNYVFFLFATGNVFGVMHLLSTFVWFGSQATFFITLMYLRYKTDGGADKAFNVVVAFAIIGVSAFLGGLLSFLIPGQLDGWVFFAGQVIGTTLLHAITPALVIFDEDIE